MIGRATPDAPSANRRLLFVSTVYPTPWEPGKGPQNRGLVEALRERGCAVRVIAPVPWTRRARRRAAIAPSEWYPTYWFTPRLFRSRYHRMMDWSIGAAIDRAFATFRPGAVLAFWIDPDGTVALRHARSHGVPCGIIAGGSDLMMLPRDPARRRVIASTLANADHVFAVGSVLQSRAVESGCTPERVSNFLCGVDPRLFAPGDRAAARAALGVSPSASVLLWVGQMVEVKAAHRAVAAAAALAQQVPELQLVLAGDGPARATLARAVAGSAALRGRVRMTGALPHEELVQWYRAASLFVLPSRSEGVPTVLLEAMACGLPFIASDVGSIRDLLPFGPSAVTPEGNLDALTGAIAAALPRTSTAVPARTTDRDDAARDVLHRLGLE